MVAKSRLSLVVIASCAVLISGPSGGVLAQEEPTTTTRWALLEDGPWSSLGTNDQLIGPRTLADGIVVLVGGPFPREVTAWVSNDGATWRASDPVGPIGSGVTAFVDTPSGVALVGTDFYSSRSGILDSADGLDWSKSPDFNNSFILNYGLSGEVDYWAGATGKRGKHSPAIGRNVDGQAYELLSLKCVRRSGSAVAVAGLPTMSCSC